MGMKRKRNDEPSAKTRSSQEFSILHGGRPKPVLLPAATARQSQQYSQVQSIQSSNALTRKIYSQTLQNLFSNQMQFLPATHLTLQDERRMTSTPPSSTASSVDETFLEMKPMPGYLGTTERPPERSKRKIADLSSSKPLPNHGNRCYRNAVLQAFFHVPRLVKWVDKDQDRCKAPICMLCCFKRLCMEYWNQSGKPQALNDRLIVFEKTLNRTKAFKDRGWNFRAQNDAGEFAVAFMDAIVESNPGNGKMLNSILGHIPAFTKTCATANLKTRTFKPDELQRVLLVGWQRPMALEQILRSRTFSDHVFELDCDKCNRRHKMLRTERLGTAPEVLIIQFQRFETKANQRSRKKMDAISYPLELDLTEFSETGVHLYYTLQAVVHHRGGLDEGHYITVAKGPDGRWELIDDLKRPQMRYVPVKAALSPEDRFTPYLLFYVKVESK